MLLVTLKKSQQQLQQDGAVFSGPVGLAVGNSLQLCPFLKCFERKLYRGFSVLLEKISEA